MLRTLLALGCAGLLLASACGRARPAAPVRDDATPVLGLPAVDSVLRAYVQRNRARKSGVFYLDAVRRGDTTRLKMSSLVSRDEAADLAPCELVRLHDEWVLRKARDCAPAADLDSLLRLVPEVVLADYRKSSMKYTVSPAGDTVFVLPEVIFYHPDVLTVWVYKNKVVSVQEQGTG